MQRLPDWEDRLHAFLDGTATREFQWGTWDCALSLADAIVALTGEDFGAPFRGRYSTRRGAALALKNHGAGTLARTLTATFGAAKPAAFALRGDAVMAGGNAGVCMGGYAVFVGDGGPPGWQRLPTWQKAWSIG